MENVVMEHKMGDMINDEIHGDMDDIWDADDQRDAEEVEAVSEEQADLLIKAMSESDVDSIDKHPMMKLLGAIKARKGVTANATTGHDKETTADRVNEKRFDKQWRLILVRMIDEAMMIEEGTSEKEKNIRLAEGRGKSFADFIGKRRKLPMQPWISSKRMSGH
jgi:hypothetical protein